MPEKQIEEWAKMYRERYEEEMLYEMANFFKSRHSELPSNIWVSTKNANHGPRLKIQRNTGNKMQMIRQT